jgi:carboxylesterase type B
MSNRPTLQLFLLGSNDNEAEFYRLLYASTNQLTFNQTQQDEIGYGLFFCPSARDAGAKAEAFLTLAKTDTPIYRYEYFGDWPNLWLYPGSGAYHTSETSMAFGTVEDINGDRNTAHRPE